MWLCVRCAFMCYLVLVLNERPQFALALASRLLLGVSGVGQAGLRRRPLHGLAIILKLHITWGLEPGLIGLHHLLRVLAGGEWSQQSVTASSLIHFNLNIYRRIIKCKAVTKRGTLCLFRLSDKSAGLETRCSTTGAWCLSCLE